MIADTFSQRFLGEQPGQVASISLLKKKKILSCISLQIWRLSAIIH